MDKDTIELQNIGLPRHLAVLIKNEYMEYLMFEDEALVEINMEELLSHIDDEKYKEELTELKEILE